MLKKGAAARAARALSRTLSIYGFDHWCDSQRARILREFTDTVTDTDLPMERVEAKWRTMRLGSALHSPDYFTNDNPDNIHMEVKK